MTYHNECYREIQPYLHAGEEILWVGKPSAGSAPRQSAFSIVFMIFWLGFAVFWTVTAAAMAGFMAIFGLLFVGIGIGIFYNMFFGRKKSMNSSIYAVTETRAIIIADIPRRGKTCTEYVFANHMGVSVENVQGNIGTIRFAPNDDYGYGVHVGSGMHAGYGRRRGYYEPGREFTTAFLMIDDVYTVYHMISERIGK